jgi:hypothetical protein
MTGLLTLVELAAARLKGQNCFAGLATRSRKERRRHDWLATKTDLTK